MYVRYREVFQSFSNNFQFSFFIKYSERTLYKYSVCYIQKFTSGSVFICYIQKSIFGSIFVYNIQNVSIKFFPCTEIFFPDLR